MSDKLTEVKRVINIYNTTGDSLSFTTHVRGIKSTDPEMFELFMTELATGKYNNISYLVPRTGD